jgi:hypothetical protein
METDLREKTAWLLSSAGVVLLVAFATFGQNGTKAPAPQTPEDSEQLMTKISQELKTARDQASKVDADQTGRKHKLEQLLGQAEKEAQDLHASLPKKR